MLGSTTAGTSTLAMIIPASLQSTLIRPSVVTRFGASPIAMHTTIILTHR
jgi:hypothetical protein